MTEALITEYESIIGSVLKSSYNILFEDKRTLICNAPDCLAVEVAKRLQKGKQFGITWFFNGKLFIFTIYGNDFSKIKEKFEGLNIEGNIATLRLHPEKVDEFICLEAIYES